ncbi:MAG: hypothetical protein ACK4IT_04765 [Thioalkalivibrionaceae bacterium]
MGIGFARHLQNGTQLSLGASAANGGDAAFRASVGWTW